MAMIIPRNLLIIGIYLFFIFAKSKLCRDMNGKTPSSSVTLRIPFIMS